MFSKNFLGFHHFGVPAHLSAAHDWRSLVGQTSNGFPPSPFFTHQPTHFPPHLLPPGHPLMHSRKLSTHRNHYILLIECILT